jgi:uncharacterized membrane protein
MELAARPPSWLARHRWQLIGWTATFAVLAVTLGPGVPSFLAYLGRLKVNPHWPDAAAWGAIPLTIQIHILAATSAFAVGAAILFKPKGTGFHRTLGWAWVLAMAVTAISSLFITELKHGALSFIHLFSGWTIIALPMAIYAIRRGKVAIHRSVMTGLFFGGLVIAGLLTFVPGRRMWLLFFG